MEESGKRARNEDFSTQLQQEVAVMQGKAQTAVREVSANRSKLLDTAKLVEQERSTFREAQMRTLAARERLREAESEAIRVKQQSDAYAREQSTVFDSAGLQKAHTQLKAAQARLASLEAERSAQRHALEAAEQAVIQEEMNVDTDRQMLEDATRRVELARQRQELAKQRAAKLEAKKKSLIDDKNELQELISEGATAAIKFAMSFFEATRPHVEKINGAGKLFSILAKFLGKQVYQSHAEELAEMSIMSDREIQESLAEVEEAERELEAFKKEQMNSELRLAEARNEALNCRANIEKADALQCDEAKAIGGLQKQLQIQVELADRLRQADDNVEAVRLEVSQILLEEDRIRERLMLYSAQQQALAASGFQLSEESNNADAEFKSFKDTARVVQMLAEEALNEQELRNSNCNIVTK